MRGSTTPQPTSSKPPRAGIRSVIAQREMVLLSLLVTGHVPLVLIMRAAPVMASLHAVVCVALGVGIAAIRPMRDVALVIAYIAGSEVLWRMTGAGLFWEFGKYGVCAVAVVALFRIRARRNRGLALGYFALLVPSTLLTLTAVDFDRGRQLLSFNLSGPLSLTLCVLFFSNARLNTDDIRRVFLALIGPVLGIAALSYFSITGASSDIEFGNASNFVTSGGFGPNQVSAMLGLGLLFALLLLFERKLPWGLRAPLLALAVLFGVQSALTFSRGGLALAFAGASIAMVYLVRDRRTRITLLVVASLLFVVGREIVVPRLEEFTKGKLVDRYTSVDPSGRGNLANDDLEIFADNPLMGVGPGMATKLREERGHIGAAHTEFTRLLSEHGVLGGLAIIMLLLLCLRTVLDARTLTTRAFVGAMVVWFLLFLAIHAMRIVAPSFVFGLACGIARSSPQVQARLPPR